MTPPSAAGHADRARASNRPIRCGSGWLAFIGWGTPDRAILRAVGADHKTSRQRRRPRHRACDEERIGRLRLTRRREGGARRITDRARVGHWHNTAGANPLNVFRRIIMMRWICRSSGRVDRLAFGGRTIELSTPCTADAPVAAGGILYVTGYASNQIIAAVSADGGGTTTPSDVSLRTQVRQAALEHIREVVSARRSSSPGPLARPGPKRRQAARLNAGGIGARPASRGHGLWGLWPAAVRDWQRN